jgi:plastocyanin
MMRALLVLWTLMFATASAAADLSVTVRTTSGRPVADAVVSLYPAAGTPPISQAHFDWPMQMAQQHLQFNPFVLVAPVGATVAFPNLDDVRHHVYSFSPIHPFQLKLYGQDETRTVRFDVPGAIALGCNIHDQMIGFIKVVDTPYAAKTGADGVAVLHGAPAGSASLHVWHPFMKSPGNELVLTVALPRAGVGQAAASVDLRRPPAGSRGY